MKRTSRNQSAARPITEAELGELLRDGPAAVDYYRRFGLHEVRHRAINLASSGAVSLVGMLAFGWPPVAMVLFMVADAAVTVVADIVRFLLAHRWIDASHAMDHKAGRMLLISDGLEDGTATFSDQGKQNPKPGTILFFGIVSTIFLVPVIAAIVEKTGIESLKAVLAEPSFPWLVGASAVLRIGGALVGSLRARFRQPGEEMIFMESGGVAVLYAGLLVLIWLPLSLGTPGIYLLFAILYLFRLGFGIFALIWTPKAFRALERRVATRDTSVTVKV